MSDRCYSTVICAQRDKGVFEKMGYKLQEADVLSVHDDDFGMR
jgi:hypothetical protein